MSAQPAAVIFESLRGTSPVRPGIGQWRLCPPRSTSSTAVTSPRITAGVTPAMRRQSASSEITAVKVVASAKGTATSASLNQ